MDSPFESKKSTWNIAMVVETSLAWKITKNPYPGVARSRDLRAAVSRYCQMLWMGEVRRRSPEPSNHP